MRKIYIFSIVVLAFLAVLFIALTIVNQTPSTQEQTNETSGIVTPANTLNLNYNGKTLKAVWIETVADKISLIPNFNEKETAFDVTDKYKCDELTNGGFYSLENAPIGLFVTDDKRVGEYQENLLFNGFFKISKTNIASISTDSQTQNTRIALQSGPILFQNNYPTSLKINSDKESRRIVVALSNGKIFFIAFYDPKSVYQGPNLGDLPSLLSDFAKAKNIKIDDALNLDGGSASSFHTTGISLPELSPSGSFFCIKK
ncbi:MAG TPA: phosphodiester glycosidase family protein [Patescibacteria group bacterium]